MQKLGAEVVSGDYSFKTIFGMKIEPTHWVDENCAIFVSRDRDFLGYMNFETGKGYFVTEKTLKAQREMRERLTLKLKDPADVL